MPYALEEWNANKAIVVNTKTGRHHSLNPIPVEKAKAQMRLLEALDKNKKKYNK